MYRGSPLPLSPDLPLSELLAFSCPPNQLGAWIRGGVSRLHIHEIPHRTRSRVLASSDLGFLLGCCSRVALREGARTVVLAAEMVIQWRALQVATATPYLPGLERLRALFPGLQSTGNGLLIPVPTQSPEAVLAQCLAEGVRVTGSRVVYLGKDSSLRLE